MFRFVLRLISEHKVFHKPEGTRRAGSTEGAICSQLLARDPGPLFDHFEKNKTLELDRSGPVSKGLTHGISQLQISALRMAENYQGEGSVEISQI